MAPAVGTVLFIVAQINLLAFAAWRVVVILNSSAPRPDAAPPSILPRYSILVALYDEAAILPQLVRNLSLIDYPSDRLEGFLLLEAHDLSTIDAASRLVLPSWLKIEVVPAGTPQTKPRALNHGLAISNGELLTIYDAEDAPDPSQLKEAAARFAAGPENLACLQAPLRVRRLHAPVSPSRVLDRQFAAEYAGLFEVVLPGMARLGLPFPLGGTSNHIKTGALRAVGGWDAYNVTEDADLGFRLWRNGYALGMLSRPTWETPPGSLKLWLPQRTRWLKGYLQTLAVHAFQPNLGWKGTLSLITTLMAGLVAASLHGYAVATMGAIILMSLFSLQLPPIGLGTLFIMAASFAASWVTTWIGAKRIRAPYDLIDLAVAPFYWTLLTLAFIHALARLIIQPHAWDKTPHLPDVPVPDLQSSVIGHRYSTANAGRKAA